MNYFRKRREREAKASHGVFCPAANRIKLQYDSKERADHAVLYGNGGLVRSYYCRECQCWHTTSKPNHPPMTLREYGMQISGLLEVEPEENDVSNLPKT